MMEKCSDSVIATNMQEYGESYAQLRFVTAEAATAALARRAELLGEIAARATLSCLGTKPHVGPLSPGCARCSRGEWSCLFINGICNGRCFYCPTSQVAKSEPMTNNLRFPNPQDYVDYLQRFDFQGASVSGGEPLLTFDRTLQYVRKIKKRFGEGIHLWLYTNGLLATEEKIGQLAEAGLNEIRFDISADHYSLEHLQLAVGRIPTITVEIPAIPEDAALLGELLPRLAEAGVQHLNLHQLRCTPHNLPHLVARSYTMVHGDKVTVLESELAALELLVTALDQGRAPAVNYCSYAYKSRFQGRAARLRAVREQVKPWEEVTGAGYIRTLSLKGPTSALAQSAANIGQGLGESDCWRLEKGRELFFRHEAWPYLDFTDLDLQVNYATAQIRSANSYRGMPLEIPLNRKRSVVAERWTSLSNRVLSADEQRWFADHFLTAAQAPPLAPEVAAAAPESLRDILPFEGLSEGLADYRCGLEE